MAANDLIFGFTWQEIDDAQHARAPLPRGSVDILRPGDYGADPLGNGMFRMVPSGDVVDYEERCRRLARS